MFLTFLMQNWQAVFVVLPFFERQYLAPKIIKNRDPHNRAHNDLQGTIEKRTTRTDTDDTRRRTVGTKPLEGWQQTPTVSITVRTTVALAATVSILAKSLTVVPTVMIACLTNSNSYPFIGVAYQKCVLLIDEATDLFWRCD